MLFSRIFTSDNNNDASGLPRVVFRTDGKIKGDERKSIIEGVLHLLMENSDSRQDAIENGSIPLVYSDTPGLFVVTGKRYMLEKSDLQMMHVLLEALPNQTLWFPDDIGAVERSERERLIRIIADQAQGSAGTPTAAAN